VGVVGQRHALAALPAQDRPVNPLYRGLGGPQDRSGRVRKILPPTDIRYPDRPSRNESLYRLSCPGSKVFEGKGGKWIVLTGFQGFIHHFTRIFTDDTRLNKLCLRILDVSDS